MHVEFLIRETESIITLQTEQGFDALGYSAKNPEKHFVNQEDETIRYFVKEYPLIVENVETTFEI
jgi:hypothetical protein